MVSEASAGFEVTGSDPFADSICTQAEPGTVNFLAPESNDPVSNRMCVVTIWNSTRAY